MAISMLLLMQKHFQRFNLPQPVTVFGNSDSQVLQALGLLEEECNELSARHPWEGLTEEVSHVTIANENQGTLESIIPGYRFTRNNTIWDTTDRLPVLGPLDGQDWQGIKSVLANGPRYQYRIRGGKLLVNPVPVAGHVWKFEWITKNCISNAAGTIKKRFFTADDDTFLLPDELILQGLRWRWAAAKGLTYAELFNTYERQVKDAMGRDGGAPRLTMDEGKRDSMPGIFVPISTWTVP